MTEPADLSAVEARRLIGRKALSPVELLESCLSRIEASNGALNAMVTFDADGARAMARAQEADVMAGEALGPLHGLPVAVKDLTATAGMRTTQGSLIYKDDVPKADDPMVANVRAAGGNIVGKTNTPEFGAGANTTNRVFGPTGNPFDPSKTCGGSSGGAAVALATGQVPLATGSDYGGSLRTPAGFCGVAGFRSSPGLVPGSGRPVALAPFSVTGPMGRSIADAHLLLRAQIAIDKRDPYSSCDAELIPELLGAIDLGTVTAAFSADLGCAPVAKAIRRTFESRTKAFRHLFAEASDETPDFADVHEVFETLRGLYFVAAHRERLEKHRDLLDRNVIDNTERGLALSLADVARANVAQTRLYRRFLAFFDEVDVLIAPAASVSPFPHSELFVASIDGEAMPTYMRWLAITYAPTMALATAAVIPCGLDEAGLPFGIQVIGPNGADALVLEVAHALEEALAAIPETRRPVPDLAALAKATS
ncbi:MAG: amidase [Hyphomicrobiaceae bacterium]|nr:amidase [Hyphomicrobiaceae bacterium]